MVGYLLSKNDEVDIFKDPAILNISIFPDREKESILTIVDHFIKASMLSVIYKSQRGGVLCFILILFSNTNIGLTYLRLRPAKEVISAVDIGAAMYSRIETGKTEPFISTLEKNAKVLGVDLSDFFF